MDSALINRMNQMRRERGTEIARCMAEVDRGNAKLRTALADARQARADIAAAKARLATLLEYGERKVVANHLITAHRDGGIHIEPVDVVSLL